MSKYCGNCGAKMDDDARICGYCGTPMEDSESPQTPPPGTGYGYTGYSPMPYGPGPQSAPKPPALTPAQKKKIKVGAIVTSAVAVVIVLTIVMINIIVDNTGYKGTIKKAIHAYETYDIQTLVEVYSDIQYQGKDMDKADLIAEKASMKLDSYESLVGRDVKISYKITDAYKLPEHKYSKFIDYIEDYYDYDGSYISEVMRVDLELEIKGKQRTKTDRMNLYLVNEMGNWYIFDGSVGYY